MKLLMQSRTESRFLDLSSTLVVGGPGSAGVAMGSLKHAGDYCVLMRDRDSRVRLHSLRTVGSEAIVLGASDFTEIDDLRVTALDVNDRAGAGPSMLTRLLPSLAQNIGGQESLAQALQEALENIIANYGLEKGLFAIKGKSDYEVLVSHGLKASDPWLSETVLKEVLESKAPVQIRNLIGSRYVNNQSLLGTGFLSLFVWPLVLRGETLGAFMVGANKPHSGFSDAERVELDVLAQICALLVHFHLRERRMKDQLAQLRALRAESDLPFHASSNVMLQACDLARRVSSSDLSVFISGETGAGKELMARWMHRLSGRGEGPFVVVNCAAIPSELLESMLFGHRKGAFTGAVSDATGKFQQAHGGTIFLDEIGELGPALQAKLLRVLQERVVEPLGSTKSTRIDVRVLSASHRNLQAMVAKGEFRQDLIYRLAEVTVELPALRARPQDIGLLATHFLGQFAPGKRFSVEAWDWLHAQEWPGNVRELQSAVKRAAVFASGDILERCDFSLGVQSHLAPSEGGTLDDALKNLLVQKVRLALMRSQGHREKAAEILGVTSRTLFRYLDKYQAELGDVTDVSVRTDA